MDSQSYVAGFVQGLIACEMLVLMIKIIIDTFKNKQDMKRLDEMNNNILEDVKWSKAVTDKYLETNERLDKIVEKLGIEEDEKDE